MANEWGGATVQVKLPPFRALAASSGSSFSRGMGFLGGELGLPRAHCGSLSCDPARLLPRLCSVSSVSTELLPGGHLRSGSLQPGL
jgi:hypothetical protein